MLATDQEELARALLERKETEVFEILGRSDAQKHLSARGKIGETPLHVASSWPRGMELLLHLGGDTISTIIDADDDNGSTALDYALKINEPDCVKMLLEASADMELESIQNIAKWEQGREKWAVIPILTQSLAHCRREILRFASESVLQRPDIKNLNIKEGYLLQEDAFELVQALLAAGIDVPKRFRSARPGSVYHSTHMNLELAQSLLSSGFDHTAVELSGFTPLMTVDLVGLSRRHEAANLLGFDPGALDLVDWFLSHGEDLNTPIPTSGFIQEEGCEKHPRGPRLAHRVASELGRCLRWPLALSGDRCTALLPEILTSPVTDSCSCLCTRDGCNAASVFTRELWGSIRGGDAPHGQSALGQASVRVIMEFLTRHLSSHLGARQFATDFIRVSTFERLGMSHTCCRFIDNGGRYEDPGNEVAYAILKGEYKMLEVMDPDDVAEIQEEERYLEGLLEVLVEEFEVKYAELGLPLADFFLTYWWVRMDEVDAGNNVSREELEALRTTGVVLDA
jgi:ankyrin repeat protein